MLRFSSQTIHDIMFPDGRLRQTFFLFLFFYSRVQNMAISFFQAPIIQKMDSAISTIWTTAREQMYLLIPNWSGKNLLKKNWVQSFISSKLFSLVDEKSFYLLDVFSFGHIKAVKKRNFSIWHGNFSRSRNEPPCLIYSFTHCFNQEKALSSLA